MKRDFSLSPTTRSGRPRRPVEIAMTPMIDVIFLLLVFFLATSSFQKIERLLPSSVSKTAEPAGQQPAESPPEPNEDALDQIVIRLALAGELTTATLNGNLLANLGDLPDRLRQIHALQSDVPIIVDPDEDVKANEVIGTYDVARQAGFTRVFMATRETTAAAN